MNAATCEMLPFHCSSVIAVCDGYVEEIVPKELVKGDVND